MPRTYIETFDTDPGGWHTQQDNFVTVKALDHRDGCVVAHSPWWVDYNHAPPGGGYLHVVFSVLTKGPFGEAVMDLGGPNRFWEQRFATDFTNARVSLRLKGELENRGANLCFHVQARGSGKVANWIYTTEPFRVTPEWSEQTITLVPDESRWTFMGSRWNRTDNYGHVPLADVLRDVNINVILVLFPLTVAPMGPLAGDMHRLRPEREYPIWRSRLPEGYIMLDTVKIEFAS